MDPRVVDDCGWFMDGIYIYIYGIYGIYDSMVIQWDLMGFNGI